MPKVAALNKKRRLRQILDAAERCFLRWGPTGASVADICAEAGIGPGHLYHYFDSKDSIIAAFAEMKLSKANDQLTERVSHSGQVSDALADAVWLMRPDEFALIFEILALATRSEKIAKIVQAQSDRLRRRLSEAVRMRQITGEISEDVDPLLASTVLIGAMDALKASILRYPKMDLSKAGDCFKRAIECTL